MSDHRADPEPIGSEPARLFYRSDNTVTTGKSYLGKITCKQYREEIWGSEGVSPKRRHVGALCAKRTMSGDGECGYRRSRLYLGDREYGGVKNRSSSVTRAKRWHYG